MVTTIRLPDELHQKLKEMAEIRGMTLNGLVVTILWQFTSEEGTKKGGGVKE